MKIAISGASGFIGSYLRAFFASFGYKVIPIDRKDFKGDYIKKINKKFAGVDAVINLAGANINHRWSRNYKYQIYHSRISTTTKIVEAINMSNDPPKVYINGSAVGYYATNDCYNELNGVKGDTFLSDVCRDWEEACSEVSSDVRCVVVRMGVVCSICGGAFVPIIGAAKRSKVVFQFGNGRQRMSWIAIEDLVALYRYIIINNDISGVVNGVAPHPLRNRELCRLLSRRYGAYKLIVPKTILKLTLGERSELLTGDQCVYPLRAKEHGFRFQFEKFEQYLKLL